MTTANSDVWKVSKKAGWKDLQRWSPKNLSNEVGSACFLKMCNNGCTKLAKGRPMYNHELWVFVFVSWFVGIVGDVCLFVCLGVVPLKDLGTLSKCP